jgi:hypothetical protein
LGEQTRSAQANTLQVFIQPHLQTEQQQTMAMGDESKEKVVFVSSSCCHHGLLSKILQ